MDKGFKEAKPEINPLISVVVAFFNIEECVRYCCDSLIGQTYDNYELILVDDGSTDATAELLDAYSPHRNVRVCHTDNHGLSAARNFGVGIASGDYVTFVDGDDIVAPHYLETLASGLPSGNARVLVATPPLIIPFDSALAGEVDGWGTGEAAVSYLGHPEAAKELMYEVVKTSAWGKLAPRDVYLANPFPVGDYYEEIATVCDFIGAVDQVVSIDAPVYGYVMRKGSIVHREKASIKQVRDYLRGIEKIERGFKALGGDSSDPALDYHVCLEYARVHKLAVVVSDDVPEAKRIRRQIVRHIRSRIRVLLADSRVSSMGKIRFLLLAVCPALYTVVFRLYERVAKGV